MDLIGVGGFDFIPPISSVIITLALTGSALIGFTCLGQVDVKVIFAYSSVVHIGLAIAAIIYLRKYRNQGYSFTNTGSRI